MIKVSDGYHLWSEKYDRELEDIFDIQDEIALAILEVIKIKLLGETKKAVLKKYTDNIEAYQLYLQGRFHYNKYIFDKAIESYQAAIALEPKYAIAYAGIAGCYTQLWYWHYLPDELCLPQMIQAAEHSLRLDQGISESHLAIAFLKLWYERDFNAVKISIKKAIELNPHNAEAHSYYAYYHGFLGNYIEAEHHATIADRLEPFSPMIQFNVGINYWNAGLNEKAIAQGKKLIELEPHFFGGYYIVVLVYSSSMNKMEEALQFVEKAHNLQINSLNLASLGIIYGLMGEKEKAIEVLERMENLKNTQWVGDYDISVVYFGLGEFETAFRYLEQAIDKKEGQVLFSKSLLTIPALGLAKDPRTEQIFKQLGLAY